MNVKAVIPARYGSQRLQGKALLPIKGKPLFWHVTQQVIKSGIHKKDIFIATDNKDIETAANELGLSVVMTKDCHISGTERVNEVASILGWDDDTLVLNVQGDEPLIPPDLIANLINFTGAKPEYDITTCTTDILNIEEFFCKNTVKAIVTEDSRAIYFTRSQCPLNREEPSDFRGAQRHIGIYVYKVASLRELCLLPESKLEKIEKLEQLRALSNGMTIGALNYVGNVQHGVDTKADYLKVKSLME